MMSGSPSLPTMLRMAYPNYFWETSKFVRRKQIRIGDWGNIDNQRKYLESIAETIGVKEVST